MRRTVVGRDPAAAAAAALAKFNTDEGSTSGRRRRRRRQQQRSGVVLTVHLLCAAFVVITLPLFLSSSQSVMLVAATDPVAEEATQEDVAAASSSAAAGSEGGGIEEAEQTCTLVDGTQTCVANSDDTDAKDADTKTKIEEEGTPNTAAAAQEETKQSLLKEKKEINRDMYNFDNGNEESDYLEWMEQDPLSLISDFVLWMEHAGYKFNMTLVVQEVPEYPRSFAFSYDPFFHDDSRVSFIIDKKQQKPTKSSDDDNDEEVNIVDPSSTTTKKHYNDNEKLFELSLTWIEKGIDPVFQALAIYSLIVRMEDIQHLMTEDELTTMGFTDHVEQRAILDYFESNLEGLTMAWMYRHHTYDDNDTDDDNVEGTVGVDAETTTTVTTTPTPTGPQKQDMDETYYDPLTEFLGLGSEDNTSMDLNNCITGTTGEGDGEEIGNVQTFYQKVTYHYERGIHNTYMHMNNWLHSSNSHRAHYHDGMIHIPLQYVKDVKRVAYIGGGDNMPLYELLKYPNIELIVGMELDQEVTRSSFQYFGTSPNYHDPRVQWWFGDASKTIKALPQDYLGSFDFVIVDLLSFVQDSIRVVADLSILDAAAVLMKNDGGVISRQDDYCVRSQPTKTMMKRVIEWDWLDMPGLCEASFTAGSNSIDLLHADRYDHGVPTLIRLRNFNETSSYDAWMRYYDHTASMRHDQEKYNNIEKNGSTATTNSDNNDDKRWEGYNPQKCKTIRNASPEAKAVPLTGFLHVIEVEDLTNLSWDGHYMKEIELKVMDLVVELNGLHGKLQLHNPDIDKNHLYILLEEGYIRIHAFPEALYVAFDVMIWDSPGKSEAIKESLIRSVGGNPTKSTSDFRVVTGGMSGLKNRQTQSNGLLEAAETVFCGGEHDDVDDNDSKPDKDDGNIKSNDRSENIREASLSLPDQSTIIPEIFTGLLPKKQKLSSSSAFAIFCSNNNDNAECDTVGSLSSNDEGVTFHPVQSCDSFDDMDRCKLIVQERIEAIVTSNSKRLDGILIGRDVTVDTGKIFHKIFNNTINQEKYLERSYVVASPMVSDEPWRNILLERFRNELVIAHPLHRADIELYNDTHKDEWFIASIGNEKFFESLRKMETSINTNTNLLSITKEVETGAKPVQYDHDPKNLVDSHFYEKSVDEQWFRQKPVAYQSLIQMDLKRFNAPLKVNDTVLAAAHSNLYSGIGWIDNYGMTDYFKATVHTVLDNDTYILTMHRQTMSDGRIIEGRRSHSHERSLIRRYSSDDNRKIIPGDFILIPKVYKEDFEGNNRKSQWRHDEEVTVAYISAIVLAVLDNEMFSVHYFDPLMEEETRMNIPIKSCLLAAEIPDLLEVEPLSKSLVEEAFKHALEGDVIKEGTTSHIESSVVGDGGVMHAVWPEGNAVMKWDGLERVEVNLFLYTESPQTKETFKSKFLERFKNLGMAFEDTFPRGYGDVVNFKRDVETYTPHWTSKKFGRRHPSREVDGKFEDVLNDDWFCNEDDDDYECVEEILTET